MTKNFVRAIDGNGNMTNTNVEMLDMTFGAILRELAGLLNTMFENSALRAEMQGTLDSGTYGTWAEHVSEMRESDREQKAMTKRAMLLAQNTGIPYLVKEVRHAGQFGVMPIAIDTVSNRDNATTLIAMLTPKNGKGRGTIVTTF